MGDDMPFQQVSLSFNFPFYQPTRYIWIDPNGALHMHSPTPPCCLYQPSPSTLTDLPTPLGCSYETPPQLAPLLNESACTLDSSVGYSDVVAVALLDLDASRVVGGVRWVDSGSGVLVEWVGVPWWVLNTSYYTAYFTFAVLLSIDGSIQFHYTAVTDPTSDLETVNLALPRINRTWLVGLRQEGWRDTETANAADYATNRTGLYPPSEWVTNGSTITFCPLDTAFCLHPTSAPLSGGTLLLLASANMTCASVWNHTYAVVFSLAGGGVVASVAVWDGGSGTLQVLTPVVNASDGGVASVTLVDVTANATVVQFATPLFVTFDATASAAGYRTSLAEYCDVCGVFNPYHCTSDCAGVYMGAAVVDACGQCSGGTTNNTYNSLVNCAGTCGLYTANWTVPDCLCEQLQYPPVVTGWVPGSERFGSYVGTVSYYVQRGLFHVSACGLSTGTDEVYTTLRPLDSYQTFLLAASSLLLALAVTQALSTRLHRPLLDDPFQPSLYMSEQPPAVVVEAAGGGVGEEVGGEGDVVGVDEAAGVAGVEEVGRENGERGAVGDSVGEVREEEVREDGELYIGASELWRRRQVQLVLDREQAELVTEEKQQEVEAVHDKDANASEVEPAPLPADDAVVQTSPAPVVIQAVTVAPPTSASAFVPPVASPFAARRR